MCMNVYYDRIKRSLLFFEKSILVYHALGNVCFLSAICRFLLRSAPQAYFACVIHYKPFNLIIYGLEKPYIMFKCQFQSKLGSSLRLAAILKLEELVGLWSIDDVTLVEPECVRGWFS